jgi:hypothetical protein
MKRSVNTSGVSQSKLEQIKSGAKKVTQIGDVSQNKKIIHAKGGKFHVTETEKKFEETGVRRKKRNYVMYESKLGTEREKNLQKIHEPVPKAKPKPAEPKPRQEEKIIQKKKKVQYLDNYQYHETKEIKDNNPNRVSIVTHQRLGDIVGGSYEETTYQKHTITDTGKGQRLYSQQSARTTTRKDAKGKPTQTTTQRSNTASRTLPAQSQEQRKEIKKYSSNTNLKSAPKKPAPAPSSKTTKTTTTKTTTKTTTTRTSGTSKPATTTVTKKTVTRAQSAGKGTTRRH